MRLVVGSHSPLVRGLSATQQSFDVDAFAALYGGAARLRIGAEQAIYSGGEPADCLFYIEAGRARLKVVSAHGKQAIIAVLEAGEFCGDGCVAGQPEPMSTAICTEDSIIIRLDRLSMMRALAEDPGFAEYYLAYVLRRVTRLRDSLISQMTDTSERRLARALLQLSHFSETHRSEAIISDVDQATLAQMVGITRARINQFMNKFRRLGYIDYDGKITVRRSLLNVLLEDDSLNVA